MDTKLSNVKSFLLNNIVWSLLVMTIFLVGMLIRDFFRIHF